MMKVRIPCSLQLWDSSTATSSLKGRKSPEEDILQVESLFSGNTAMDSYKRVSEVVAWDFSLGMALGCLLTRQPNESEKASTDRIGPFMFLHLKGLSDA